MASADPRVARSSIPVGKKVESVDLINSNIGEKQCRSIQYQVLYWPICNLYNTKYFIGQYVQRCSYQYAGLRLGP